MKLPMHTYAAEGRFPEKGSQERPDRADTPRNLGVHAVSVQQGQDRATRPAVRELMENDACTSFLRDGRREESWARAQCSLRLYYGLYKASLRFMVCLRFPYGLQLLYGLRFLRFPTGFSSCLPPSLLPSFQSLPYFRYLECAIGTQHGRQQE